MKSHIRDHALAHHLEKLESMLVNFKMTRVKKLLSTLYTIQTSMNHPYPSDRVAGPRVGYQIEMSARSLNIC